MLDIGCLHNRYDLAVRFTSSSKPHLLACCVCARAAATQRKDPLPTHGDVEPKRHQIY